MRKGSAAIVYTVSSIPAVPVAGTWTAVDGARKAIAGREAEELEPDDLDVVVVVVLLVVVVVVAGKEVVVVVVVVTYGSALASAEPQCLWYNSRPECWRRWRILEEVEVLVGVGVVYSVACQHMIVRGSLVQGDRGTHKHRSCGRRRRGGLHLHEREHAVFMSISNSPNPQSLSRGCT